MSLLPVVATRERNRAQMGVARPPKQIGDIMKKTLVAALLCSASVVGVSAGSAFAGEVTGTIDNPNPNKPSQTPIGRHDVSTSACAYSGLEDGVSLHGFPESGPGITQTPHYEDEVTAEPGAALPAFNTFYNCVGLNGGKAIPGRP